jgi:hypothetical protein
MADPKTLATWEDDGTSYTVTLNLDNDKPTGMTIDAVTGDKTRRATLPIDYGSLEYYANAWSEAKPVKKLTADAERALALAERLGYG